MNKKFRKDAVPPQQEAVSHEEYWAPQMPKVLHTLSNKLLPIVAFSDLGSRRCDDPKLREYFDKIRQAADDSRELVIHLRQQFQQHHKDISDEGTLSSEGAPLSSSSNRERQTF